MGIAEIWRLRRQPAILPHSGKLLWWTMVPARMAKSLGLDILRGRFVVRPISFIPATTSLSDAILAIRLALSSKSLVDGPHIAEFEKAFADYIGLDRAVSFNGGRVALNAILKAMDIGPGDEVILPAYTCVVVPNAILYAGAQPVFADIDPKTYNLTAETVAPRITKHTKAILAQHTFGLPVDLEPLLEVAGKHQVRVIEDCATALGAVYKGRRVGTWGDAALFSLDHSKMLSTEEGGIAVANDPLILERLLAIQAAYLFPSVRHVRRLLAQTAARAIFMASATRWWGHMAYTLCEEWFGFQSGAPDVEVRGELPDNYYTRLSNAQARLGLKQLRVLDRNLATRCAIGQTYEKTISRWPLKSPRIVEDASRVYPYFTAFSTKRDEIADFGARHQVDFGIFFASVVHPPSASLDRVGYQVGSCPMAERVAQSTVQLPTHPLMTQGDVDRVIDLLDKFSKM
jgi:perosamine synthetase